MAKFPRFRCITCGTGLVEESRICSCELCGETEETGFICPNGHYFCVACRMAEPCEIASRVCSSTRSKDPFCIADTIMRHPHFLAHSPAFHFIVAPALIASAFNSGFSGDLNSSMTLAADRMQSIPAMSCGSFGGCGASLSVGAALSILIGADHLTGRERSIVLEASGKALGALACFGTPRCCRQAVYSAVEVGIDILREHLGIVLSGERRHCSVSGKVAGCHGKACRYSA